MKTLKDIYNEIDESIEVGDLIYNGEESMGGIQIQYSRDWHFAFSDTSIAWRADKYCVIGDIVIYRNGKQLYPKKEEYLKYKHQWGELVKFSHETLRVDIHQAQDFANILFDYIGAVVRHKESK
ncbi:hypothetical protein EKK58_12060 [Candidatus Dependentiae bacterium]|nr:MAG: hypothetical protein EKK58_12060 [Candidatus Dependentiae bacterium]